MTFVSSTVVMRLLKTGLLVIPTIVAVSCSMVCHAQQNDFVLNAYPNPVLPGINIYLTVRDEGLQNGKPLARIFPLNYSSNTIVTYLDSDRMKRHGQFQTGNWIKDRVGVPNPNNVFDSTCIVNNLVRQKNEPEPAVLRVTSMPVVFKLRQRSTDEFWELSSTITHSSITTDEKVDYEFLEKHKLLNTFRTYYTFYKKFYAQAAAETERFKKIRADVHSQAMPDAANDVNVQLNTIELLIRHLEQRTNSKSRYLPYLQAKLVYDLGIYEQKQLQGTDFDGNPIPPLSDKLRVEVLRYLENELQTRPNPLLQYHYAAYVVEDHQRSKALLKAACEKTDDGYLKKLAQQRIEIVERLINTKK